MKENDFNETAKYLQKESNVILNYIESKTDFASKLNLGRWDEVLEELSQLNLPPSILVEVHEQVNIQVIFLCVF